MKRTSPFSRLVSKPASSPGFFDHRSAGVFHVHAHRVRDDVGQGGFPEAGRTAQQNMLEDVAALFRRLHQEFEPFAHLHLAGELAEHRRPQRDFESGIGLRRFHRELSFVHVPSSSCHDQFRAARFQNVIHLVEGVPDQVQPEPARFDQIMRPPLHRVRRGLLAVIAQPHPNAIAQSLERKRDQLIVPQMIGVPNNVGAGFVYPQHHERAFLLGKRVCVEKSAHEFSHQSEIARVAGELDFLFFHQARRRLNICRLIQVRNRKLGGQPEQA